MATRVQTAAVCTECGQRTLVQEWIKIPSDGGADVSERVGLARCVNPHCVKADLAGFAASEEPRAQRG
jgi:hypothetical protein